MAVLGTGVLDQIAGVKSALTPGSNNVQATSSSSSTSSSSGSSSTSSVVVSKPVSTSTVTTQSEGGGILDGITNAVASGVQFVSNVIGGGGATGVNKIGVADTGGESFYYYF